MLPRSLAALSVLMLLASSAPALDLSVPEKVILKNGLRIIVKTDRSVPHVALTLAVLAGSSQEQAGTEGSSKALASLWASPEEWDVDAALRSRLEDAVAVISARNDPVMLQTSIEVSSDRLADALALLSADLSLRKVSPKALSRIQEAASGERQARANNPRAEHVLSEILATAFYGKHPLGTPKGGRSDSVHQLTPEQLEKFAVNCLVPSRACLAIVGDITMADLLKVAPAAFPQAAAPVGAAGALPPPPPVGNGPDEVSYGAVNTAVGLVGFRIPGMADPDFPAAVLLAKYLSLGRGSVLHRRLVERESQVSDLIMRITDYPVENLLSFELVSTTDDARNAAKAVLEEIARIARQGVDAETLEGIKSGAKASRALGRQKLLDQAVALARAEEVSSVDLEVDYATRLDRVTPEEMQRVAVRYLSPRVAGFVEMRPRSSQGTDQQKVVATKVPDGPTVVVHRDSSSEVVGIAVHFPGGLYLDPMEKPGLSSLLEEALMGGATSVEAPENTLLRLDRAGAQIHPLRLLLSNASTRDGVSLCINATLYNFEELLETFHNILFWPRFDEAAVERAKETQLAKWRAIAQNPEDNGDWEMASILYPDGEYSRTIDRLIEQVPRYTMADLKEQHLRLATMGRTVVAITGNVSPPRVLAKVTDVFSGSPRRASTDAPEKEPAYAFEPLKETKSEARSSQKPYDTVWVGFKLPHEAVKDMASLTVWWMLLGGDKNGVFRERALAVDPGARLIATTLSPRRYGMDITYGFRVAKGKGDAIGKAFADTIAALPQLPLSQALIEKTHRGIQATVSTQFQDKVGQATKLAYATFVLDQPDMYERTVAAYATLTTADLARVRDRYLKFGQLLLYKGR